MQYAWRSVMVGPHADSAGNAKRLFEVLVCTCDAYDDTWMPFFTLLKGHWPGAETLRFILTTETKDFQLPGLTITCAKTGMDWRGRSRPWGKRVLASLKLVEAPLVLLILDDYFIDRPVQTSLLEEFAAEMCAGNWDSLELLPQGDKRGQVLMQDQRLVEIADGSPYRVNTQAALWRPTALRNLLKAHESPWEFETRGTSRARRTRLRFMRLVNHCQQTMGAPVVSYPAGGGIWRGRWNRETVVDLFARHCIEVDYCQRGFYVPSPQEPALRRKGIRRLIRKDLLSLVTVRVGQWWSEYRSFR